MEITTLIERCLQCGQSTVLPPKTSGNLHTKAIRLTCLRCSVQTLERLVDALARRVADLEESRERMRG